MLESFSNYFLELAEGIWERPWPNSLIRCSVDVEATLMGFNVPESRPFTLYLNCSLSDGILV